MKNNTITKILASLSLLAATGVAAYSHSATCAGSINRNNSNKRTTGTQGAWGAKKPYCKIPSPVGVSSSPRVDYATEPGVSLELAKHRKEVVKSVAYDVCITVPEDRALTPTGRVVMHVNLASANEDLVIDYAPTDSLTAVSLPHDTYNEHIIIPSSALSVGDNDIALEFKIPWRWLNRRDDFVYTLSVPDKSRYLMPCFDQPDLKAVFNLQLTVPNDWKCVANGAVKSAVQSLATPGYTTYNFEPTLPISTYLFSFVAGRFNSVSACKDGRTVTLYHKEEEAEYVEQCDEILRQVFESISWMEEFTGIPMPYPKYDLVVVPGFQFGGMEHPGAILYNDKMLFLPRNATLEQQLSRTSILAHETAHLWFGDMVTMEWFNEVWIKEVFANYFAACVAQPIYGGMNHSLQFMLEHAPRAYSEDRTPGSCPIEQELSNLKDGGMVYGNIIYYKSPMVIDAMIKLIEQPAFREGIRDYLRAYSFGNATFDNLVEKLDYHTPIDLKAWSKAWVYASGMPEIKVSVTPGIVRFSGDSIGREQRVAIRIDNKVDTLYMKASGAEIAVDTTPKMLIPNCDGNAYGYFAVGEDYIAGALSNISALDENARGATLINAYEAFVRGDFPYAKLMGALTGYISSEENALLYGQALSYIEAARALNPAQVCDEALERALLKIVAESDNRQRSLAALRTLSRVMDSTQATEALYAIWQGASSAKIDLSEVDAMAISYQLAIHMPQRAADIVAIQRSRLTSQNLIKEYDFVAPSVSASQCERDSVFESLLKVENRGVEPWVRTSLANLNHRLRRAEAVKYLKPGLEVLEEIKNTGDIFFPKSWLMSLFSGHERAAVAQAIDEFLCAHPDYLPMLRSKILFFR